MQIFCATVKMESKLISIKILRHFAILSGMPSKFGSVRSHLCLTKSNSKSLSTNNSHHASMAVKCKNKMEAPNRVNYFTLTPYCDENLMYMFLKGEIFGNLPPLNAENAKIILVRTANIEEILVQITKNLFPNFAIPSPVSMLHHAVSSVKNYRLIDLKNFSFCNSCSFNHVIDHLTDTETALNSSIVFMNNTPKGPSDTGGVKGGSDSENEGDDPNPKSDPTKDPCKTKSDSGHESGGTSSPSGNKPSTSSQSPAERSTSEGFSNFPEEIVWDPMPDDVELGFEEEMSESNRQTDERWYPHSKPPTPQTQVKYFPKIYYEEVTTYEPSKTTPLSQPPQRQGPPPQFRIYEDPEEEPRHWSQISFNTPPSPIPVEGPQQFNRLLDTPPSLRDQSPEFLGRTIRIRRRVEYMPEENCQPLTSTPTFQPPFSSTMVGARRNLFSEFSDSDSPSLNREASLVRNSERLRASSPGTPPRSSRFTFSPEPIRPTGRKQGDRFVYSDEEDAGSSCRPPRFVLSPEPVTRTQRKPGETFVISNVESDGSSCRPRFSSSPEAVIGPRIKLGETFVISDRGEEEDPRAVTHIRESVTTCDECNCIEEVRETTVRKRVFPNDGSLPVGQPIVKTQVTKSMPMPDCGGDGKLSGGPKGNLSAPNSSCVNCGRPSGVKKKTSTTNSTLLQNLKVDLNSTLTENTNSLCLPLVSDNFISYNFETISNKGETIVDELNGDKSTWTMINFFPHCHVRFKERLLSCTFANYRATYPLRIGFLDL